MNKLKLLSSLLITLGLFGCSTGQDELEKLCKKDAGVVIYKQAETDGYFNGDCKSSCWSSLPHRGLKFIEIESTNSNHKYLPRKGYWRIYISDNDDPYCNNKITENYKFDYLKSGHCFASKKINELSAKYGYKSSKTVRELSNQSNSVIGRFSTVVYDLNTNKVLSEKISYQLDSKPGTTLDGGPYICKSHSPQKKPFQSLIPATFINVQKNLEKLKARRK